MPEENEHSAISKILSNIWKIPDQQEAKLIIKRWRASELYLLGPLVVLGILFSLIHLFTWGLPTWREARRYVSARCVVVNPYIHNLIDQDGHIGYRPEVLIQFQDRAGRDFLCKAYDRTTLSESEGYTYTLAEASKAVRDYLPGETLFCRYLPEDPTQVILKRDFQIWGWLFMAITVSVAVFGTSVLVWLAKKRSVSAEEFAKPFRSRERYPTVPTPRQINESPGTDLAYRLLMTFSPIVPNLIGLGLAALWSLIALGTFIFVLSVCENRLEMVFAILFCLIFCGLGAAVFCLFLRRVVRIMRTGTSILEISNHPVYPNRTYRLSLRQNGYLAASSYTVEAVCEEIARYRQGTNTLTNRKEVLRIPLFSRADFRIPSGETCREEFFMKIPPGAMHTFHTHSNDIRWKISVLIRTGKSGTICRECPIIVMPYSPDAV